MNYEAVLIDELNIIINKIVNQYMHAAFRHGLTRLLRMYTDKSHTIYQGTYRLRTKARRNLLTT
jgi:hypothetical protein